MKRKFKENIDREYKLLKRLLMSLHAVLILSFLIASLVAGYIGFHFSGTVEGTIALSLAVAFVTATIVDFAYNYVTRKDSEKMIAKHLMLNKEVQEEIMSREKVGEIFNRTLETLIGSQLAEALNKSIIDKIKSERDLFLMERAYYSVILKNSTDSLLKDFFEVEMISKYNTTLKSNTAIFYVTDGDKMFEDLAQKVNEPYVYLIYELPEGCGKMIKSKKGSIDKFIKIDEFSIDGRVIEKYKIETEYDADKNVMITIQFDIPSDISNKIGENVRVHFKLRSILWKYDHVFFRQIPRAFPSIHMSWDCTQTDIEYVDVYHSFLGSHPEIERLFPDGSRIDVRVEDWVLPNNMVTFVWRLKGEREGK